MPASDNHPRSARRRPARPAVASRILVATEGSDSVSSEIRVARALADRHGSTVDVVSVVVPILPAPLISDLGLVGSMNPIAPPSPDLQGRRHRIGDELARAGRPTWNVTVLAGRPSEQIADAARRLGATLIVMGIGRHAPIDRLMGSETALQVMQLTDVPVLAVAHDLAGVPRHALAAVDFTSQSETAAETAAELVADDGTLFLTHVRSDWVEAIDPQIPVDLYAAGIDKRFEQLERRLATEHLAPRNVQRIVRNGEAVHEILAFTKATEIDLIAVGARSHSRLHRILSGSVAAKLLRGARCSVLVIPARAERARRPRVVRAAAGRKARATTARSG